MANNYGQIQIPMYPSNPKTKESVKMATKSFHLVFSFICKQHDFSFFARFHKLGMICDMISKRIFDLRQLMIQKRNNPFLLLNNIDRKIK